MLSGIALLGVVTANIAAWFISRFERDNAEEMRQTALLEALTLEWRCCGRDGGPDTDLTVGGTEGAGPVSPTPP